MSMKTKTMSRDSRNEKRKENEKLYFLVEMLSGFSVHVDIPASEVVWIYRLRLCTLDEGIIPLLLLEWFDLLRNGTSRIVVASNICFRRFLAERQFITWFFENFQLLKALRFGIEFDDCLSQQMVFFPVSKLWYFR